MTTSLPLPNQPTRMSRRRRTAWLVTLFALVAASCGSGPDLPATIAKVEGMTAIQASDVGISATDASGDAVRGVWSSTGSPAAVANAIETVEKADERTDDAGGDVFLLYRSGTLWVKATDAGSAVVYYADNDKAYNRHSVILLRSSRWGSRVNTYRTSTGSSSSNGFRGGGSSSGK